jgi:hypothetical protein
MKKLFVLAAMLAIGTAWAGEAGTAELRGGIERIDFMSDGAMSEVNGGSIVGGYGIDCRIPCYLDFWHKGEVDAIWRDWINNGAKGYNKYKFNTGSSFFARTYLKSSVAYEYSWDNHSMSKWGGQSPK